MASTFRPCSNWESFPWRLASTRCRAASSLLPPLLLLPRDCMAAAAAPGGGRPRTLADGAACCGTCFSCDACCAAGASSSDSPDASARAAWKLVVSSATPAAASRSLAPQPPQPPPQPLPWLSAGVRALSAGSVAEIAGPERLTYAAGAGCNPPVLTGCISDCCWAAVAANLPLAGGAAAAAAGA